MLEATRQGTQGEVALSASVTTRTHARTRKPWRAIHSLSGACDREVLSTGPPPPPPALLSGAIEALT